jgi:hypothetical protein
MIPVCPGCQWRIYDPVRSVVQWFGYRETTMVKFRCPRCSKGFWTVQPRAWPDHDTRFGELDCAVDLASLGEVLGSTRLFVVGNEARAAVILQEYHNTRAIGRGVRADQRTWFVGLDIKPGPGYLPF